MNNDRPTISWSERDVEPTLDFGISKAFFNEPKTEEDRLWDQIVHGLRDLVFLPTNWDGYGAEAPDPDLVDSACQLLATLRTMSALPVPSRILPTQDGGVLVEWQTPDRYLEAEIVDVGRVEWMFQSEDAPTVHREFLLPRRESDTNEVEYPWLNVSVG